MMKTIYILYVSLLGPVYDYEPLLRFHSLDVCIEAAESLNEAPFTHHVYCQQYYVITQPDGSVRPVARP